MRHRRNEPWVLTAEPGIYIAPDDEEAPEQFRGIGIRIEDDVLVTAAGNEVMTAAVPKVTGTRCKSICSMPVNA